MMQSVKQSLFVSGAAALSCSVLAHGQAEIVGPMPVDQGYGDVSPLQTSQRVLQPSRRLETAFEGLYQHPGLDGKFFRQAGGIYAVFDQSDYVATRFGTVATVPAGTTYYIGAPSWLTSDRASLGAAQKAPVNWDAYTRTARSSSPVREPVQAVVVENERTETVSDELIRKARLAAIAGRALRSLDG